MSLNKIVVMGRLTRDPELRQTPSGVSVTSFTVACDRDFRDKQSGERGTDFIDVVAWRQTGEFVANYFTKGRMAVVEGRLQMRDWTDKDGNKRRNAEIVADHIYFGDSKTAEERPARPAYREPDVSAADEPEPGTNSGETSYAAPQMKELAFVDDGDLPF